MRFHTPFLTLALAALCLAAPALAAEPKGFLETAHRHTTVASTVPENGDQNPYGVFIAPVTSGKVQKDDVLVSNFNNAANLQGTGSTIVDYNPATKKLTTLAAIPRNLPGCPGGVGLGTALVMLKSGWVIVGSTPSTDGTTGTKGQGCLIVLNSQGEVSGTITGPDINGPWGNMAVTDRGGTATLFISMAGFDLAAPVEDSPEVPEATVLRLELAIADGKPPAVTGRTVVGSGFAEQADKDVFMIGPTGLALGTDGTLYVSDAVGNRINAIRNAATRPTSAGIGRVVTQEGLLKRPLALTMAPNGHLLVVNGLNGQVVEIDPISGKQIYAQWIDTDKAQTPPGSGDLFGLAMTPAGDGFYYVEDDVNTLVLTR